jgi:hypothetical protein
VAEVCGTVAAVAGFVAGYLPGRSLLAAAGLATLGEFIGFYGCVGAKTALAARRATPTWPGGAGWWPGYGTRSPSNWRRAPSPRHWTSC